MHEVSIIYRKRVSRALFCFVLTVFSVGCAEEWVLHKIRAYDDVSREMAWGELRIWLEPTKGVKQNSSVSWGAPYSLNIWFLLDDKSNDCTVLVENIVLFEPVINSTALDDQRLVSPFDKRFGGQKMATFRFSKLYLDYTDYFIELDYYFRGDCNVSESGQFKAAIPTNYHEEVITLWDVLMGV